MKTHKLILISAFIILALANMVLAANLSTTKNTLDAKGSRNGESSMGDLAADAMRDAGHADIGFVTASLLNDIVIPAGPVTDTALNSALAFPDDTIVVLSLKGIQIRRALERSLELYPKANSAFLQVSGINMVVDPAAPAGSRAKSIRVNGTELESGRSYEVAMPISLGRGSLGYFRIWNKDDVVQSLDTRVAAAVTQYAKSHPVLSYSPGSRIEIRSGS